MTAAPNGAVLLIGAGRMGGALLRGWIAAQTFTAIHVVEPAPSAEIQNLAANKAIALHHFGGCLNQGVKISKIWPQVATHFNNQVPNGDSGGSTNKPPVASFTSTCNGLVCSFSAAVDRLSPCLLTSTR